MEKERRKEKNVKEGREGKTRKAEWRQRLFLILRV